MFTSADYKLQLVGFSFYLNVDNPTGLKYNPSVLFSSCCPHTVRRVWKRSSLLGNPCCVTMVVSDILHDATHCRRCLCDTPRQRRGHVKRLIHVRRCPRLGLRSGGGKGGKFNAAQLPW